MKIRSLVAATNIAFMFVLVVGNVAQAAELKVLSSIGMQGVLETLGPKFEYASGHKLAIMFDSSGDVVKRVRAGETVDVVVIPRQGIDSLVKDGKAIAESVIVLARSGIGPLPGDLQDTFSAAIIAGTKDAEAGKALINFLRTREAAAVIKAKGMEPAAP